MITVYPFRPGDWVWDGSRPATVKRVYDDGSGEVLLDLVIYSRDGEKLGRQSPACGGPRTFEPACSANGWQRIAQPKWPIEPKWVEDGYGKRTAQLFVGPVLPPAEWSPPKRRSPSFAVFMSKQLREDNRMYRRALEAIADGHNDARNLACIALGRTPKKS